MTSLRVKVEAFLFVMAMLIIAVSFAIHYYVIVPLMGPLLLENEANEQLTYALLTQIGAALFFLLVLCVLFRRIVMNPLKRLAEHVTSLGETNDLSLRLDMARNDEIGILADEFNKLVAALARDIENRRRTADALRHSEERYALAVRGANDGLWDWDLQTDTIHFSTRWKDMLGFEEHEFGNQPDAWFKRIHPDDIDNFRTVLSAHLQGRTSHFETEHRILHRDGTYLWVLCRGLAVFHSEGNAMRMAGSQTDITPRKIIEEQLGHQALHDSLTMLPNRALFVDRLSQALKHAQRDTQYLFAVIFLDVDRFKIINDGLGHMIGDMLLKAIGEQLSSSLRASDTVARSSGGTIARFGGDEFVLLVDGLRSEADINVIVDRIMEIFKKPFHIEGHDIFTSVSLGIAMSSTQYKSCEEFLRSADTAMYRAKAKGQAHYEIFDIDMHAKAMQRLNLENDLRRAIEREEFVVFYQPIIDLKTGRIAAFEALVRWRHPERGLVPPVEFIPIAEETGMIVLISKITFKEALHQTRAWQLRFPAYQDLDISFNLSVKELSGAGVLSWVEDTLREASLDPRHLKLEITESAIMESIEFTNSLFKQFRSLNIQLSIDDFGTGYSSLSYLHQFPMDNLKIDRAFVRDMDNTLESLQVVKTIVLLAHALRIDVVAEGIEEEAQLRQLLEFGCQYGQGFYFSPPVDAETAASLLEEDRVFPAPSAAASAAAAAPGVTGQT